MGGKTITRASIADVIHFRIGLSRQDSSKMADLFFEEISAALADGQDVKLSGFGSFKVKEKNARVGRNPRTKEEAVIAPRKVITFSASPNIKQAVNETHKRNKAGST